MHLPLVELDYNNSFRLSIFIAPYEALYSTRYRSPMRWYEVGESSILGLDLICKTLEKVHFTRNHLQLVYSQQKSYAEHRRRDLEF